MRFYLVGMPGCGKSTFGKRLSSITGYNLIDLDMEIIRYTGKSIDKIFTEDGEDYFREIETSLLKKLSISKENFIMATGGGVPCFFDNMEFMNNHGITLYIKTSPEDLEERLSQKGLQKRPLLSHLDENSLLVALREKLDSRAPYYEKSRYTFLYHNNMDQDIGPLMKKLILEKESD
ncbi:shikimate kinase [Bacteroidota bacterium]